MLESVPAVRIKDDPQSTFNALDQKDTVENHSK